MWYYREAVGNDGKRDGLCSWARANYLPGLGPRSLLCHMTISRVVCGHEILPHFLPVICLGVYACYTVGECPSLYLSFPVL